MAKQVESPYDLALREIESARKTGQTELNLSDIGLTTLPPEIGKLTALKVLSLGSNQLTSVPTEIGKLTDLLVLDLGNNQFTMLPREIGKLTALRVLFLSDNKLTALPTEMSNLTALQTLILYSNKLTTLPTRIGNLAALQGLDLRSNQLTTLPTEIGKLTALQHLDLSSNQLTDIPKEIGNLKALQKLYLLSNQLTNVPTEIGKLKLLQELYLNSNQLSTLPMTIGGLTALQVLDLSSNQLTKLPAEIGKLAELRVFDLSINKLLLLPQELKELSKLEAIFLHGNDALALPAEVLGPIRIESQPFGNKTPANPAEILKYYFSQDVNRNRIHDFKTERSWQPRRSGIDEARRRISDALASHSSTLDLGRLGLSSVPKEIVQLRSFLTELYIHENQIGPRGAIQIAKLTDLTHLSISFNDIKDEGAIALAKGLPKLISLRTGGNHISKNGAEVIASSLRNLEILRIGINEIGDEGAIAIANSIPNLKVLYMSTNGIGNAGAEHIAKLSSLTELQIWNNEITDGMVIIRILRQLIPREKGGLPGGALKAIQINGNRLELPNTSAEQQDEFIRDRSQIGEISDPVKLLLKLETYLPESEREFTAQFSKVARSDISEKNESQKSTEDGTGAKGRVKYEHEFGHSRDASFAEAALNVGTYASTIAQLFDRSSENICFGLFGHWGRGKTYLMNVVGHILTRQACDELNMTAPKYQQKL